MYIIAFRALDVFELYILHSFGVQVLVHGAGVTVSADRVLQFQGFA